MIDTDYNYLDNLDSLMVVVFELVQTIDFDNSFDTYLVVEHWRRIVVVIAFVVVVVVNEKTHFVTNYYCKLTNKKMK